MSSSSSFRIEGVVGAMKALEFRRGLVLTHVHERVAERAAPSIGSVTPVMKAAASLKRKQIAALTSASVPSRRSGTWSLSFGISAFTAPS